MFSFLFTLSAQETINIYPDSAEYCNSLIQQLKKSPFDSINLPF